MALMPEGGTNMAGWMGDGEVIQRILDHADAKTTDLGEATWREPVENYRSVERFQQEMELFRRLPLVHEAPIIVRFSAAPCIRRLSVSPPIKGMPAHGARHRRRLHRQG